jgi:hypothetical protein
MCRAQPTLTFLKWVNAAVDTGRSVELSRHVWVENTYQLSARRSMKTAHLEIY